jgi:predicted aconitase
MSMHLTDEEKSILDGAQGEPKRMALQILSKLGEANDADRMIPIASSHLVGCSYQIAGEAGIEIYSRLVEQGARVAVHTTLDPGSIDFLRWQEFKTPADYAARQKLIAELLEKMGVAPIWTCTPYYLVNIPHFGEDLGWSESNAVAFVNSVIGARTNRMSAYVDLCTALLGKTPRFGLHVPENRRGDILFELEEDLAGNFRDFYFPVLGYMVGQIVEDKVPVITGLRHATFDQLKAFGAAAASSGAVALYHMVGITPEARSLDEAFQGGRPSRTIRVGLKQIQEIISKIGEYDGGRIDVVGLGCPHASLDQLRRYVQMLAGRKVHPQVELFVCLNEVVEGIARKMGYIKDLEEAGVRIMAGTCLNNCPLGAWGFNRLATDSGKFAYYTPTTVGTKCSFVPTETCIEAAVSGCIVEG